MGLYTKPGVYQSTWIEMESDVAMRYETERDAERVTLFFGDGDEYVLSIGRESLDQLLRIGATAKEELDGGTDD
jgi:hypothetical protein